MKNLFYEKILTQKANEIDLNKDNLIQKREILNKWIDNIEKGKLGNSKEEALQGEFLQDIFSKVLNAVYFTDNTDEWNLERETKTEIDGQKADGILGFFSIDKDKNKNDIIAVIELKGPNINLDKKQKRMGDTRTPVEQAFGYAPKYGKNCQWVIVSNFKEIRLYRSNTMLEYQVFYLENLKDDLEFKKFIYVLSFDSLVGTESKKAKAIELNEEYQKAQSEIEKRFYNEYKQIRINIFENVRKNNENINDYIILEKVQKLLDRFLFICFCEDKNLLPANSFIKSIELGKVFKEALNKDRGIFESFKMLCNWIDAGNKAQDIPYFNGGLFKQDKILDNLIIDDYVFEEMKKISNYDFDSELNENILGHIFEQSISDIEELKKNIAGEVFDIKKGKRKKDGIFYTPKYITKYIVEKTINYWLEDKRKELGEDELPELSEKDFIHSHKNKTSEKKIFSKKYQQHIDFWRSYKEAIKNIKILDPACGSGAFLITAFEFLLNENRYIDEKLLDLTGETQIFSDTTKEILENNIFGVDLNKESIEITKLSLWLKTANKNKTLTTLENNIKCGNSLIDDEKIAGELAFNWQEEFPKVFEQGGFDIIIGNPPYVATKQIPINDREFYWRSYKEVIFSEMDLYEIFIYKMSKNILKEKGNLGFITPNSYFTNSSFELLRKYLVNTIQINEIIDFPYRFYPFEEVNTETAIILLKKIKNSDNTVIFKVSNKNIENLYIKENFKLKKEIKQFDIIEKYDSKIIININFILDKLLKLEYKFRNYLELYKGWMSVPKKIKNNDLDINKGTFTKIEIEKYKLENYCNLYLEGSDIHRYYIDTVEKYVYCQDMDKITKMWHYLPKLILQRIVGQNKNKIFATIDLENRIIFPNANLVNLINKDDNIKFYISIVNSSLISYFYNLYYGESNTNLTKQAFENIPIVCLENIDRQPFIEKADTMLDLNKNLQELSQKFQRTIKRKFNLEKLPAKLEDWYLLEFSDFIKELNKLKIKLSLSDEANWEDYFIEEKVKALSIKNEIETTDKEIDNMVYKLYNLTDDEIKIIEN